MLSELVGGKFIVKTFFIHLMYISLIEISRSIIVSTQTANKTEIKFSLNKIYPDGTLSYMP